MQVFKYTSAEIAERNIPAIVLLIANMQFQISILGHISHVNTVWDHVSVGNETQPGFM